MLRDKHRETFSSLRATHTAHRVATEVANPHLESSTPQPVIPTDNTIPYAPVEMKIARTAPLEKHRWKIWWAIMLLATAGVIVAIAAQR